MTTVTEETEETEETEFTKKRHVAIRAQTLADHAYCAADVVRTMLKSGLKIEDILREVGGKLRPREVGIVGGEMLVDLLAPLLSIMIPILEQGENEVARIASAVSAMQARPEVQSDPMFAKMFGKMETALDRVGTRRRPPLKTVIKRLLAEATSPLPDQTPAIECGVMLAGVPITIEGSLSETPEGGLRLLSAVARDPDRDGGVSMIEQFFSYEDVMVVAVRRTVTVDAPRIIRS